MIKDDFVYLGQMYDMALKAIDKIRGLTKEEYDQDENLRMALAHIVQTIGEAARRVSPDFQQNNPDIPWPEIIGMRHKIVHDYLDVDDDIIHEVVDLDLPDLIIKLKKKIPPQYLS